MTDLAKEFRSKTVTKKSIIALFLILSGCSRTAPVEPKVSKETHCAWHRIDAINSCDRRFDKLIPFLQCKAEAEEAFQFCNGNQ